MCLMDNVSFCIVRGKECIILKRALSEDSYSSDEFFMYAENCHQPHFFICELENPSECMTFIFSCVPTEIKIVVLVQIFFGLPVPVHPSRSPQESEVSLLSNQKSNYLYSTLSPVTVIRSPGRGNLIPSYPCWSTVTKNYS